MNYFNSKQTAKILSTSPQRLANLRMERKGPPYCKIGSAIRYSEDDLKEYMDNSRVIPVRK
jgi:hypothetical protein